MTFKEYIFYVKSDLYRYSGDLRFKTFLFHYLFVPGFKYSFWMRSCKFLKSQPVLRSIIFPFAWLIFNHYQYKFGIFISYQTSIGKGFYIGHCGGIVINPKSVIGNNCNISHQVTLGASNRGERKGEPTIGNNVYIGPGVKIIGKINIGHNVAIGSNCVVTKDIPDNSVVVGIPGKVISEEGSLGYINNTDYE